MILGKITYYPGLVKEFYANMTHKSDTQKVEIETTVKDVPI